MDPKYYGLVEMAFSGAVVLGFCGWQLWSVERELRKSRGKQNGATSPERETAGAAGPGSREDDRA